MRRCTRRRVSWHVPSLSSCPLDGSTRGEYSPFPPDSLKYQACYTGATSRYPGNPYTTTEFHRIVSTHRPQPVHRGDVLLHRSPVRFPQPAAVAGGGPALAPSRRVGNRAVDRRKIPGRRDRNGRHGAGDNAPERRGSDRRRRRPLRGDDARGTGEVRTGGAIRKRRVPSGAGGMPPLRGRDLRLRLHRLRDPERGRPRAGPSGDVPDRPTRWARGGSRILLAAGDVLRGAVPVLLQERPAADRWDLLPGVRLLVPARVGARVPRASRLRGNDAGGGLRFRNPPPADLRDRHLVRRGAVSRRTKSSRRFPNRTTLRTAGW